MKFFPLYVKGESILAEWGPNMTKKHHESSLYDRCAVFKDYEVI